MPTGLHIFTDGSCKDGRGSWAYVVIRDGGVIAEASGWQARTNSLHMEFRAAIEALRSLPPESSATLSSDSRILVDAMKRVGKPLTAAQHQDEIQVLFSLDAKHQIVWRWVKAHAGNVYNERCDELCVAARTGINI